MKLKALSGVSKSTSTKLKTCSLESCDHVIIDQKTCTYHLMLYSTTASYLKWHLICMEQVLLNLVCVEPAITANTSALQCNLSLKGGFLKPLEPPEPSTAYAPRQSQYHHGIHFWYKLSLPRDACYYYHQHHVSISKKAWLHLFLPSFWCCISLHMEVS